MPSRSAVGYLLAAALLLLALLDGGSVVLTRMSVPDDTESAGHTAAAAVENLPTTKQTAVTAFEVAQAAGAGDSLEVHTKDFTLYPDDRVTLTASRTAPTLVFHRLPWLRDLVVVTSTATVGPLPFT
jgi:thiazole synthase ThiGH ThiG subunit